MEEKRYEGIAAPPQTSYPVMAKKRLNPGFVIAAIAILLVMLMMTFLCGTCFITALSFRGRTGNGIGLVQIEGVISSDSAYGTSAEDVVEQLHEVQESKRIKAVVLRINSPGGTPAASQEIAREVRRTIRKGKPVVASIGDVGASGAYYVASQASLIIGNPDSDVGSIGVIVEIPNVEEMNKKIGLHFTVLTEGKFKDIGSSFRDVTEEEKQILTSQMKMAYENFIKDVSKGRNLDESKVRELANGLTYPGTEAKRLKLIDETGNFRDAVNKAGKLGGLRGDIEIISLERKTILGTLTDFLKSASGAFRELRLLDEGNGTVQQVNKR